MGRWKPRRTHRRIVPLLWLGFTGCLIPCASFAQPENGAPVVPPFRAPAVAPGAAPLDDAAQNEIESRDSGVLRRPPRELQRQLDRAEKSIAAGDYQEAIDLLVQLLSDTSQGSEVAGSDFLVAPEASGTATQSLRGTAWRMIRDLPAAARELYELRVGTEASDALQEAITTRNPDRLRDLVARYRNSRAGDEALLLLGRFHLDHGAPRAADRCFQQLAQATTAQEFEPQLSLLRAMALIQSGQRELGRQVLLAAQQTYPTFATAQGEQTWTAGADPLEQFEKSLGSIRQPAPTKLRNWLVHRGSHDRNPTLSEAGVPLPSPRWRVRVALISPDEERFLAAHTAALVRSHEPSMPGLAPLAVNDTILMRSTDRLVAIDFTTGKYLWEWPWEEQPDALDDNEDPTGATDPEMGRLRGIEQRVWDDAPYGQMSSDGESVYVLHGLDPRFATPFVTQRLAQASNLITNELVALDLKSQGKFLWRVGGTSGFSEPKLADVFFMGPPLPDGDHLYVIGELRGEVILFCLASKTGALQWSQQLAFVQNGGIFSDQLRRLIGASPSLQDDVLVCPTSCGAIVALDLTSHAILWGYQYSRAEERHRPREVWSSRLPLIPRTERWLDATVAVANGAVIASPPESEEMVCLDLNTGEKRWSLPRASDSEELPAWWFVAAVDQGHVLTVGPHHVASWNLQDGKPTWPEPIELPDSAAPSGRGFLHEGRYYLPTTAPALVEVDLAQGQLHSHATETTLGNTISYRDHLITQTATELSAYYQREALAREVATRLQTTPLDPWALERKAQLEIADGNSSAAIETLRLALAQYPAHDPRRAPAERMLFDALLARLKQEIANSELAREAESLVGNPQQHLELLRLKVEGFLAAGNRAEATRELLHMNALSGSSRAWRGVPEGTLRRFALDGTAFAHESHWLAMRFADIWDQSDVNERAWLDAQIRSEFEGISNEDNSPALERFVTVFQAVPSAADATLQLARQYEQRNDTLGAELLLRAAQMRMDDQHARWQQPLSLPLLVTLSDSLHRTEQYDALRASVAQLRLTDLQSIPKWQDKSAAEWGDQFAAKLESANKMAWPAGRVEVKLSPLSGPKGDGPQESRPVRRSNGGGGIPWSVKMNRQMQLSLHNPRGQEVSRVHLPGESMIFQQMVELGQYGPLVALTTRNQIAVLDTSVPRGNPQDFIRWSQPLDESVSMNAAAAARLGPVVNWPWGDRRVQVVNMQGQVLRPRLGPVLPQAICYLTEGRIICANPLNGERIWERPLRSRHADIWGDDKMLFVSYDDQNSADVLSTLDGEVLGTRAVPAADRRWTTIGRLILTWKDEATQRKREVQLLDPWSAEPLWSMSCAEGSRGTIVEDDEVAILEPTGNFTIRSLRDGTIRVEAKLDPEPELTAIQVTRMRDQTILWTDVRMPADSRPKTEQLTSTTNGFITPLYGRGHAFSRTTGERLWQVPAFIDQYSPLVDAPMDVPLLVLARVKQAMSDPSRRLAEVIVLDARDGRLLWQGGRPLGQRDIALVGDPDAGRARLFMSDGTTVEFIFTDQPRPPAPPAQTGRFASRSGDSSSLQRIAGAVLRAFGTLDPLRGEDEPDFRDNLEGNGNGGDQ